jgi:hypothetical protein
MANPLTTELKLGCTLTNLGICMPIITLHALATIYIYT